MTGVDFTVSEASLTPLDFLERSARVWSDQIAVRDRSRISTYAEHHDRVGRWVGLLRELGVREGDRVAVILPNTAELLELHYAVPGAGGVLVPLNTRLSAAEYAYILGHSEARLLVVDRLVQPAIEDALAQLAHLRPEILWVEEESSLATSELEACLASAACLALRRPADERTLMSINYTSGTTGRPKGVMVCHRGAFLHALGVIAEASLTVRSSYLWTLPMFHCNGWAYTWAVTAMGSVHVCLREVNPDGIWSSIRADGITHLCAAPTVVSMMLGASSASPAPQPVRLFVGGAPPAPALLERAAQLNIDVTHLYGLTETYGPIAVCAWNPSWDALGVNRQAQLRARQGVGTVVSQALRVVDRAMNDVPADGQTVGEVVMRGNNVMLGYYKDPAATATAFEGGWFHSGDLGVMHPDGYLELRDRLKDIVITGGENVATIEIEQALMAHDSVSEAAVVGAPDAHWGEIVIAFVTARGGRQPDTEQLREFLRERIARFKVPKEFHIVDDLPKTATGKIKKFALRDWRAGMTKGSREPESR